jgi:hypothetical protein
MANQSFYLKFPGSDPRDANINAERLGDELANDKDIVGLNMVEPQRERIETMDFGGTLVLMLGTASVTALARGILTLPLQNVSLSKLF